MEKSYSYSSFERGKTENKGINMAIASSGHKLGQLIGDWFEEYFVFPLLIKVGKELDLFVDTRFVDRSSRNSKIIWTDIDDNDVDYDAVLEIGGSSTKQGIPVAFLECFWRRGSRHSKDKARDDSGKLMPMRDTYPTARFLGIIAAGDFTKPAKDLIRSREIDLFYITKLQIIEAFGNCGLVIDYNDKIAETEKSRIVDTFAENFHYCKKMEVKLELLRILGSTITNGYVDRVKAALSALPQEIRIILRKSSEPIVFDSVAKTSRFIENPQFDIDVIYESFVYEVTYSDGTEFVKEVDSLSELRDLHREIEVLEAHMSSLDRNR